MPGTRSTTRKNSTTCWRSPGTTTPMVPTEPGRAAAPVLALVINAFVWGVSWWPLRQLQSHGLHPLWATAGVYLAVLAVLALLHPKAWRGLTAHPEILLLM